MCHQYSESFCFLYRKPVAFGVVAAAVVEAVEPAVGLVTAAVAASKHVP